VIDHPALELVHWFQDELRWLPFPKDLDRAVVEAHNSHGYDVAKSAIATFIVELDEDGSRYPVRHFRSIVRGMVKRRTA
jgi:hypothetical protein